MLVVALTVLCHAAAEELLPTEDNISYAAVRHALLSKVRAQAKAEAAGQVCSLLSRPRHI